MRRSRVWTAAAVLVLAVGAFAVVLVVKHHNAHSNAISAKSGTSMTSIPVSGGVRLGAEVFTPRKSSGSAHPLIVMPTSWGAAETQYQYVGQIFAAAGYEVVAYTQRGFLDSGGKIDFAGSTTVADASTVIDWALKHTPSDAAKIGMLGDSYGAGVSLLAAERDSRIKAVAALSTWTDWAYSFAPNDTVSTASLKALMTVGQQKGHLGTDLTRLNGLYESDPAAAVTLIDKLATSRSPITDVAALNKHHTAVLMANGMQDSIFAPQQLVNFYDKLTGPKRLELGVGDHTQPEVQGFLSTTPVGPVGDAFAWMNHYLLGASNGVETAKPIQITDSLTHQVYGLTRWPTAATTEQLPLPDGATNTATTPGDWTALIATGTDTAAASPAETVNVTVPYQFATAAVGQIASNVGLRWSSPSITAPLRVVGTPRFTLNVGSTASSTSLFVYLYDVAPSGTGTLMSVTPLSETALHSGSTRAASLQLSPVAWTVAAGHHLSLVVDTVDGRWSSRAPAGSTLAVASTTASPAVLSLPTG